MEKLKTLVVGLHKALGILELLLSTEILLSVLQVTELIYKNIMCSLYNHFHVTYIC
jgi:hypothetical protein